MKKYIALLVLIPMGIIAQQRTLKKAEKNFEKESFISAIKVYEHLANNGMGSELIFEKLGDANYFNANYLKAEAWYSKRYELKGSFPKEFLYRYGQSLKSAQKDKLAQEILAQYASENPTQLRSKGINGPQYQQESILKGSDFFSVNNININSEFSDYSSTLKGDTLVFASARPSILANQIYSRTNQSFTNLYSSIKSPEGTYSKAQLFSKESYSIFHEASATFTKDGLTMYYTQNQLKANRPKRATNGSFKIYKSVFSNGKWKSRGLQDIFAKDSSNVAHPSLTPDGKTLYFASDAQASFGQSDLFKVNINEDGTFTTPENLGNDINTEGRESYPFVTKDNILLFASDGHPGLGGFDIFALDLNKVGALPVHLIAPLNSAFDDFGIYWDRLTNNGVFTSNRPGGKGDDDLYSFENKTPFPFKFDYDAKLIGKVVEKITNTSIPNASLLVYDMNGKELARTISDANGNFVFDKVQSNASYRIKASKDTYSTNEAVAKLDLYDKEVSTTIEIDQDQYKIEKGLDLAKALAISQIYFDLDRWNIRKDARTELEKILIVLQENPTIKIEIGSHTDSRQSKSYNLTLSQKRAQSTLIYLVKQGIAKNRLTAKGYGESQLATKCENPKKCTEAEHQLNRRSTFIIVSQ